MWGSVGSAWGKPAGCGRRMFWILGIFFGCLYGWYLGSVEEPEHREGGELVMGRSPKARMERDFQEELHGHRGSGKTMLRRFFLVRRGAPWPVARRPAATEFPVSRKSLILRFIV